MIPCALIGYFLARFTRDLAYSSNVGRRWEVFSLQPSQKLKDVRARLGITTRDVSELSQKIADHEGNSEFHISNAWLTQIENSDSVPSIFKLYSLSAIYRIKFTDMLSLFGVELDHLHQHQLSSPLMNTHLTTLEVADEEKTVSFPVRFDRGFDIDNTNLLSRMVEVWGEIPIALIRHLDIRRSQYGYIGLKDYTLYPLVRPGSFVQVDQNVRKIQPRKWRTEYDRPIYFIELRDGYACSWCELQDGRLFLIPHPLSPCTIRNLAYGADAEIVGQVTAVAMRITDGSAAGSDVSGELPGPV
jgi:transcriptional regulator with XRE-family HTH domain